jgi:hypothetical protein
MSKVKAKSYYLTLRLKRRSPRRAPRPLARSAQNRVQGPLQYEEQAC